MIGGMATEAVPLEKKGQREVYGDCTYACIRWSSNN